MTEGQGAAAEWRTGWPLVIACTLGMTLLNVGFVTAGTFIAPLERQFGWSRAEISSASMVYVLAGMLLAPPVGMLLDRWGVRRVALPGAMLTGLAIALFSTLDGSIVYWLLCWLLLASATQFVMTTVWVAAVSHHFTLGRKLALSIVATGIGLSTLIAPNVANYLIEHHGWRLAYLMMGLGWGGFVALVGFFALHDHRSRQRRAKAVAAPAVELPGYTVREGLRSTAFAKILCAGFICSLINIALMFHMVPILSWSGLNRDMAVLVTSSLGITMLAGNIGFGLVGDRVPVRVILAIVVAAPAISCAILLQPASSVLQGAIAANVFGICTGAQMPAFAYLSTRYFGLRSLGTLRGFTSTSGAIATAIGPFVAGLIFDRTGGYMPFLLAGIPMLLLSGALLQSLGPYPRFEPATA